MDVHARDICIENMCCVLLCTISCRGTRQLLSGAAIWCNGGLQKSGEPAVVVHDCSPPGCLSSLFVKTSEWQVFYETPADFSPSTPPPVFPLSLYPALLLGMKEPYFFLCFTFWPSCQAARCTFSLKAVTQREFAAFLTTLESK